LWQFHGTTNTKGIAKMNEERMKVLEMVADGTISAEDAAKLLDALNDGGSRTCFRPPLPPKHPRHERPFHGIFHVMGGAMGDMMKEMRSGLLREEVPDDAEETDDLDEELPDGTALIVKSAGGLIGGGGGSVTLTRSAGGNLVARAPEGCKLRVSRSGNEISIYIGEGETQLEIPDKTESLDVRLKGGGISASDLPCPFRASTMGGSVSVSRPSSHFSVKTMGGNLDLTLDGRWSGSSKAKTMGGGVTVALLEGFKGKVDASTMGGSVETSGVTVLEDKSSSGSSRKTVFLGDQDSDSLLVVKTMGGGVEIRAGENV
jgi:hypothetical protein